MGVASRSREKCRECDLMGFTNIWVCDFCNLQL